MNHKLYKKKQTKQKQKGTTKDSPPKLNQSKVSTETQRQKVKPPTKTEEVDREKEAEQSGGSKPSRCTQW